MINAEKIYFSGIGGSGCSSMAFWLKERGFEVAGSDISESKVVRDLVNAGISVHIGHSINDDLKESDLVVFSSAIKQDNIELVFARENGKSVIKRAKMLALMCEESKNVIAVCGSAGKSSSTGFLASVFNTAKLNPSVILGGVFSDKTSGTQVGDGKYFICEADEYDRSFLEMQKINIALCVGIEAEHLDIYGSLSGVKEAFLEFFDKITADGSAILCIDSAGVRQVLEQIKCKKITFGFSDDADYRAANIKFEDDKTKFDILKDGEKLTTAVIKLIGNHNVLNALGAIVVAIESKIDLNSALAGAENFSGIKRRIEKIDEVSGISIFNDYAHHPTKIAATLSALQGIKKGRIISIFQPHTFTRVRDFAENFASALENGSDVVLMTEIYAAREKPIDGVDERSIARFFKKPTSKFVNKKNVVKTCAEIAESGDIVVVIGAGDIDKEIDGLVEGLSG